MSSSGGWKTSKSGIIYLRCMHAWKCTVSILKWRCNTTYNFLLCKSNIHYTPGGGTQLFSGRGVRPGFPKCGACETDICLWKGGLVSGKFPNLGACELKISKFGGLWAKIWVKIEAVEAKISKFSQKGVLWTDSFAWNGTLASGRRGVKRGSSGPHIPIPFF